MSKIIRLFLQPLRIYAVVGFILSLVLHALAIAGLQPGSDVLLFGLGFAIFSLWLPVVQLSMPLVIGLSRKEAWKAMLSGCPKWMGYALNVLLWYAMANFVGVIVIVFSVPTSISHSASAPRFFWVFASSYYMVFYFAGLAMLTTVYRMGMPTCPNGHRVSLKDKYCPTCGAPILLAR